MAGGKWYAFEDPITGLLRSEYPWDKEVQGRDGETRLYFDTRTRLRDEKRWREFHLNPATTYEIPYGSGMTTSARLFYREIGHGRT